MCRKRMLVAIEIFTWCTMGAFAQGEIDIDPTAILAGQGQIELGFEAGTIRKTPTEWFVPTAGWQAELTDELAASGSRCLKLHQVGASDARFGNVMQSTANPESAGRHIVLTARIRVEGQGQGRGQMWLRVDRKNGETGAFDNMSNRPILPGEWRDARIEADIEADAAALNIGFMSLGGATLFIDDVRMSVFGDAAPVQPDSPPAKLSPRGSANLVAAARLLSYVRFFHPADQAVGVSWDHFAVDLMERCESAANAKELAERLRGAFGEIAPTVEVWAGAPKEAPRPKALPQASRFAVWKHTGAGAVSAMPGHMSAYYSVVQKISPGALPGGPEAAVVVKDLGGGVSCRVPIAVPADGDGTLPHGRTPPSLAASPSLPKLTARNRSTRLAGVALAWGIFQHFYPYFDVVKTGWEAALPEALARAATDADHEAYVATLRVLVAKLQDGHGGVWAPSTVTASQLPLVFDWAGDDLVVVGKHASVPDSVEVGDAVVSIDGRPIADWYAEASQRISAATEGWRRFRFSQGLGRMVTKDPAKVALRKPDGKTVTVELARSTDEIKRSDRLKRPSSGSEIAPGVVYFDLDGADSDALSKAMPALEAAKAIVFDLRGYPGEAGIELLSHLIDEPATSARWRIPIVSHPDRQKLEWHESGRWHLVPTEPRLKGEIAFLTGGGAISYAESVMGVVEYYGLGEIVGSRTAGTNGNVNPFELPGGYRVSWTGMQVLKHDGTRHHGVGIEPTVPVTPTARGVAAGRDEVLEKAVEVVQAKIAASASPRVAGGH